MPSNVLPRLATSQSPPDEVRRGILIRSTALIGIAFVMGAGCVLLCYETLKHDIDLAFGDAWLGAVALLLVGAVVGITMARRMGRPVEVLATNLRFAEARHASFWAHTPESLFTVEVTEDERFVFAGINPAHERLTGLLASRIVGREPHECLTPEVAEAVTRRYRECVRREEAITYDETLDLPGGLKVWRTSLAPVRDPATDRIKLLFGSARDVTQDLKATAELQGLNDRLQSILTSVSDCYCTFDREYRMTAVNAAALEWLGLTEEAAVGTSFADVYAGPYECAKVTRRVMEGRSPEHVEVPSGMRPGRWLDYQVYPSPEGVSVFFRDITERIEARQALEDVRGVVQAALDALAAHVALIDGSGTIISVNAGWKQFARANELGLEGYGVGTNYLDICRAADDEDASRVSSGLEALLRGTREDFNYLYACGDRWFQLSASRFSFAGKVHAVVAHEDVTEVRAAQRAVSELSQHLLASQEEERRRIASELHDSTAQHLVSVSLNMMRLAALSGETGKDIRDEIEASLDQALKELRVFTYLLHPPRLHVEGLGPMLRTFVEGFARRAGLDASFHASPALDGLDFDLQRSVLRVVQEALLNAHRHAHATHVAVNAKVLRGSLFLRIQDNGRGMPEGLYETGVCGGATLGVGIPGMRTRLRQFGGDLTIRSRPGRTTLVAAVPLTQAA